jgi:hypothetical protein
MCGHPVTDRGQLLALPQQYSPRKERGEGHLLVAQLVLVRCNHRPDGYTLSGNSLIRSADRIATEKRHLKRKWKAHITFENYKSQDKVAMHVSRRQSVALA